MSKTKPSVDPCPFCGGRAEVAEVERTEVGMSFPYFVVSCRGCGASGSVAEKFGTEGMLLAIEKWNTRKSNA